MALWLTMEVSRLPERLPDSLSDQYKAFSGAAPGRQPSFRHDCVLSGRTVFYWAAEPADKVIAAFTATTIKYEHHRYLRGETRFTCHASLQACACGWCGHCQHVRRQTRHTVIRGRSSFAAPRKNFAGSEGK